MHKNSWFISMASKIGFGLGIIILGFAAFAIHKETQKKKEIQSVIDQLQAEADKIDRNNKKMKDNLEFLSSVDYLEIEAKEKLNQKNPDEQVVVLKTNAVSEALKSEVPAAPIIHEERVAIANHRKWWNYFFKY